MVKKMFLPVALILVCVLMGGCFNSNTEPVVPESTMVPGAVTANPTPDGTMPSPTTGVSGATSTFDWNTQAMTVQTRIAMLSEIQECRVVVSEGTALVGVKFTNAYQGEMTQRIRDMIAGEVMAADSAIQVVAVTAEEKDVAEIYALSDQMANGTAPADLKQKVDQIARNTTTLR